MSAEGFFHDAHEVYVREVSGAERWIATFATKALAETYVMRVPIELVLLPGQSGTWALKPV